jgi:hypothetical protein
MAEKQAEPPLGDSAPSSSSPSMEPSLAAVDQLLGQWRNGLRIEHIAHSRCAARCERFGRLLGITTISLSAIVGTSIFSSISSSPDTKAKIVTGMLSVIAGVSATLQTFLNYPERAERHRRAALAYGSLRRRLEEGMTLAQSSEERMALIGELRPSWNSVDMDAPGVPQRLHSRAVHLVVPARTAGR